MPCFAFMTEGGSGDRYDKKLWKVQRWKNPKRHGRIMVSRCLFTDRWIVARTQFRVCIYAGGRGLFSRPIASLDSLKILGLPLEEGYGLRIKLCVCVCVIFINLHKMTVQPGSVVISIVQCYSRYGSTLSIGGSVSWVYGWIFPPRLYDELMPRPVGWYSTVTPTQHN